MTLLTLWLDIPTTRERIGLHVQPPGRLGRTANVALGFSSRLSSRLGPRLVAAEVIGGVSSSFDRAGEETLDEVTLEREEDSERNDQRANVAGAMMSMF
jgi:hypothetical protein